MRRAGPVDPGNTVITHLDRALGNRTQKDTDAEIRDLQRGAGEASNKRIKVNQTIKGKLTIRKQSDRALEIQNEQAITQFLIGTQTEANGEATPYFAIGGNITDAFTGFALKSFGLNGDIYAPAGFLNMKTHSFARWSCGCHHVPGGTTLEEQGMQAWTAGTIVNDDSPTGSWALYSTAATIGDAVGPFGSARFRTDQDVEAIFRIKMGSAITSQRVWVGLFESDPSATDTPIQNFVGFRYSTAAGDATWKCVTGDGAARTLTDSTIVVAADQTYYLRLRLTGTLARHIIGLPGVDDGFQNGTFTVNTTTTLPTITTRMAPYVRITALANSIRGLRFGFANFLSR